jgi:hypothetical protein
MQDDVFIKVPVHNTDYAGCEDEMRKGIGKSNGQRATGEPAGTS